MNHAVLDLGEVVFNRAVDILGNIVSLHQCQISVGFDLGIDINLGAEQTGLQTADTHDAILLADEGAHLVDGVFVAGFVNHLIDGVAENINGSLENKQTDDDAGNRVEDREAQLCAGDTDQCADGRQCVGTMVPCIGHQCAGVNFIGGNFGKPVHPFFGDNRNDRCNQCECARCFQCLLLGLHNLLQSAPSNAKSGSKQNHCQDNGSDTFHALMTVGVFLVGLFAGDGDTDHDDEGAEHIRGGVDGVRNHRARVGEDARQQFKDGEHQVDDDAENRYAHRQLGFIFRGQGLVLVFHSKLPPV